MADSYVCSGAMMKCTMGTSPATLTVLPNRMVFLAGQLMANISDHQPMVNLAPFGLCRSLGFPPTASATAAALGTLTPMPCMHNTPAPWMPGKTDYFIKGQPALLKSCTCQCMWGGTISLINNGQGGEGAQGVQKGTPPNRKLRENKDIGITSHKEIEGFTSWIEEDEAANLAHDCYEPDSAKNPDQKSKLNGWNEVKVYNEPSGFKAKLYEKNGKYVFATAGTDFKSGKDWATNVSQQFGFETKQYEQSIAIAKELAQKYPNLIFVGHSLGGGLASANSRATGRDAIVFNPSALSKRYNSNPYNSKIATYISEGDILDFVNRVILRQKPEGEIIRRPVAASFTPTAPLTPGGIPAFVISQIAKGIKAHCDINPIK